MRKKYDKLIKITVTHTTMHLKNHSTHTYIVIFMAVYCRSIKSLNTSQTSASGRLVIYK